MTLSATNSFGFLAPLTTSGTYVGLPTCDFSQHCLRRFTKVKALHALEATQARRQPCAVVEPCGLELKSFPGRSTPTAMPSAGSMTPTGMERGASVLLNNIPETAATLPSANAASDFR